MLDRIDICVETLPLQYSQIQAGNGEKGAESSASMQKKIAKAQKIQNLRYQKEDFFHNANLPPALIKKYCIYSREAGEYLADIFQKMELSARVYHKVLKVSRTIADLEGVNRIEKRHIAEAVCYRMPDKKYWGSQEV